METLLPLFFVFAMGLALLIYVVLDGYDLGIGMLLPLADDEAKDVMIASIGPFWDANETWIVLGVGILLIAFPQAHGLILSGLYLPVTIMLLGLILRGVAFDFRVKAGDNKRGLWNRLFFIGSAVAALAQGWMLGAYITGLTNTPVNWLFAILIALTMPALYIMLGAAWLLIKTEGALFDNAVRWAKLATLPMGLALLLVSIATPLVSPIIADKWFTLPNAIGLLPIPLTSCIAYATIIFVLSKPQVLAAGYAWLLYLCLLVICLMAALGLAYSIFPDIIIGRMTIWQAAAATKSLQFTFVGVVITLPAILVYTIYIYHVFGGKTTTLKYD